MFFFLPQIHVKIFYTSLCMFVLILVTYGKHSISLKTFLPNHSTMQTGYVLQPNQNQWTFVSIWFLFYLFFCIEVFVFRFSLAEIPVHPFRVQLFYGCQFSRFFFLLFYLSFAVRTWRCCETKTFHSQHFVYIFIQESNWLSDITRFRNNEPTNCDTKRCNAMSESNTNQITNVWFSFGAMFVCVAHSRIKM